VCATLALLFGVVAVGVTSIGVPPAAAIGPADLSISASPGTVDLQVGGGSANLTFTITNRGPGDVDNAEVDIEVPLDGDGVSIVNGPDRCDKNGNSLRCRISDLADDSSQQLTVTLGPPADGGPAPGESRSGDGQASVNYQQDFRDEDNSTGFRVNLAGKDKPKSVTSVAGKVTDSEKNKPVGNAKVTVTDGAGKKHTTATNNEGKYKLESSDAKPIAPGALRLEVSKKGYETKKLTKTADEGESVTLDITLDVNAPSASAEPSDTGTADTATPTNDSAAKDEGGGWLSWLLYILAALLVLGGIGAIVWLFVRRNEDEESDEYGDEGPDGRRPGYDPYGAPTARMGGDQHTAVIGAGMDAPTSMIDRPGYDQPTTMMNRAGLDQPTSMIGRPGVDQPTQAHPGPLVSDDVYPQGREHYAEGTSAGYGPRSGYGHDSGYGADPAYGRDSGYSHDAGRGRETGYDRDVGHDRDPGYSRDAGYGRDSGYDDRGYGSGGDRGYRGSRHAADDEYDDRGYQPRRSAGRHSAPEDRRLDWFED
jgi:hypothetical protein